MIAIFETIQIGNLYTEDYLKVINIVESPSLGLIYTGYIRRDLDAQDPGVINNGVSDTSDVYEIVALDDSRVILRSETTKASNEGKLFRPRATKQNSSTIGITLEIPAGTFIKITNFEVNMKDSDETTRIADLEFIVDGSISSGTVIPILNFNDLFPRTSLITGKLDATVTGGTSLLLDRLFVSAGEDVSDFDTAKTDRNFIFGDKDVAKNVTLKLTTTSGNFEFARMIADFIELDSSGKET